MAILHWNFQLYSLGTTPVSTVINNMVTDPAGLVVLGGTIGAGSDNVHVTLKNVIVGVKFLNAGTPASWWGIVAVGGDDTESDAQDKINFVKNVINNSIPP
jgi:hypothetical protein